MRRSSRVRASKWMAGAAFNAMVGFNIREVVAEDTDAIVDLWRTVFPEYFDPAKPQRAPKASIERKLAFDDGLFWLAETAQGVIVGTVMAGYDGHRGWIYSFGVAQDLRGTSLAGALLLQAENALQARGCVKINMQVGASNARALAFYANAGYEDDGLVSLGKRF
jgi:ribosomal protein S18 acetylase RimI-like enzyme